MLLIIPDAGSARNERSLPAQPVAEAAPAIERTLAVSRPYPRSHRQRPDDPRQVRKFCTLKPEAQCILKAAMEELGLSARAHDKVLRVERKSVSLLFSGGNRRRFSDFDGESEFDQLPQQAVVF